MSMSLILSNSMAQDLLKSTDKHKPVLDRSQAETFPSHNFSTNTDLYA